ncbi:hypothetical protein GvMRE_I1g17 [endosymbiont GvMRE of Glomus versiforme]|nr:hypothetical protein GvMRE_I1g17 [endosymbiont GvMRE of Glomus versiforme]
MIAMNFKGVYHCGHKKLDLSKVFTFSYSLINCEKDYQ